MSIEDVVRWIDGCTDEERATLLSYLRAKQPIHALEGEIGLPAEAILDAIGTAAGLTLRMLRGVLAEAAFARQVLRPSRWNYRAPTGDHPYDYLLEDDAGGVRIQVKLQRSVAGQPMMASNAQRALPADHYVVETWKTRSGRDGTGQGTRLYRFGEFDLLAGDEREALRRVRFAERPVQVERSR